MRFVWARPHVPLNIPEDVVEEIGLSVVALAKTGEAQGEIGAVGYLPHRVQGGSRIGVESSRISPEIGRASQDHVTPKDARPISGEFSWCCVTRKMIIIF